MNIYEALREDHERQRDSLRKLVETSGESDERKKLFKSVREELEEHAAAEEKWFYRQLMRDDLTLEKARHSVAEHKEIDDYIEELEKTDMSSPGWLNTAEKLKERVFHHLEEEEHEVFQLSGKMLTETEKKELSQEFMKERSNIDY